MAWLRRRDKYLARLGTSAVNQQLTEALSKQRGESFQSLIGNVSLEVELRAMRSITARFADRVGVAPTTCEAIRQIDAALTRDNSAELEQALSLAESYRPDDFRPSVLRGRIRDGEGRHTEALEFYDPGRRPVGASALEVYRLGVACRDANELAEAERLMSRAVQADQTFSLALRAMGDLVRERDPQLGAEYFSRAIDYRPQLVYGVQGGSADTTIPSAAQALLTHIGGFEIYRNFALAQEGTIYVAYPVPFGPAGASSRRLTRTSARFMGLFLLRFVMRNMPSHRPTSGERPKMTGRVVVVPARRSNPLANFLRSIGLGRLNPPLGRLRRRISRIIMPSVLRQKRRLGGWLGQRLHYFQFTLGAESVEQMKELIDLVYDEWLIPTGRAGRPVRL